jgi:tetratricopeptide (TPR) repeat protein
MNQPFRTLFILVCFSGFLTSGCNNPGNKKDEDQAAFLHNPPFASITDSIRRAGPGKADTATRAELYFRRAELLSRNNLHELAAADYQMAWGLKPDEATGLRYSSTLSITGQTQKAIQLLKECRHRFPSNTGFAAMLGDIYQQSGQLTEALHVYDTMLESDSLNFEAWYEKGLLLEKTNDTTGAIRALGKAYALQPVNTYALELAHLYAEQKNPAALHLCDEVLAKDSAKELLDPLFIKGIYYSNTAQYKKAIVQFDSCIRRDWKFTDAYLEKGIALYKQKDYEEALKIFMMTVNVSNSYPDGYFWIGRCYEATGRKDQASLYYQRALALDKDFTEAAEGIRRLR